MNNQLIIETDIEDFELYGDESFDLIIKKLDGENDFYVTRIDYKENDIMLTISPTSEIFSLSKLNRELFVLKDDIGFCEKVTNFKFTISMGSVTYFQDSGSKWNMM